MTRIVVVVVGRNVVKSHDVTGMADDAGMFSVVVLTPEGSSVVVKLCMPVGGGAVLGAVGRNAGGGGVYETTDGPVDPDDGLVFPPGITSGRILPVRKGKMVGVSVLSSADTIPVPLPEPLPIESSWLVT